MASLVGRQASATDLLLYPSQYGAVISPAGVLFGDAGFAGFDLYTWKQSAYGAEIGDIGSSVDSQTVSPAFSVLMPPPEGDGAGFRIGGSYVASFIASKGKVGIATISGGSLDFSEEYKAKTEEATISLTAGARPMPAIYVAAQLISSEEAGKSSVGSTTLNDGVIRYSQVRWHAAWRDPESHGHELGISWQPRVQVDEPGKGSVSQERVAKLGYSRAFTDMNAGVALSWHEYSKIDSRLEIKASYDVTVERALDDSIVGIDWSWQPAYYDSLDALDPVTMGRMLFAVRYVRAFEMPGLDGWPASDNAAEFVLSGFYSSRKVARETDPSTGRTWDAVAGSLTGAQVGLRHYF